MIGGGGTMLSQRKPTMRRSALLLSAALLAAPALAQPAPAVRIDIALSSFKFAPEPIRLVHGRAYVLHFENRSGGGHDFTAKDFFVAATISPGDTAKVTEGEIALHGHESVDVRLIAPAAGTYSVKCGHFMHAMLGMKTQIVVS